MLEKTTASKKEEEKMTYVLDASITGVRQLDEIINKKNVRYVLTSVTIEELENLSKFRDVDARDARKILAKAAENPEVFEIVLIPNGKTPDDSIVEYCMKNSEKVILITSDKKMALKARMYKIITEYYAQNKYKKKLSTLYPTKKIGDKLFILTGNKKKKITILKKGVIVSNTGTETELEVGEEVLISTKKEHYYTFAHYKIISKETEKNCRLIYSITYENEKEVAEKYRNFLFKG